MPPKPGTRVNPDLEVIEGHIPTRQRLDRRRARDFDTSAAVYVRAPDGRAVLRGQRFTRSEARKIVPRRKHDLTTPAGLIKRHAYNMDTTREQIATALGVKVSTLHGYLGYRPHALRPWMVHVIAPVLALSTADVAAIMAAGTAKLGWPPADA